MMQLKGVKGMQLHLYATEAFLPNLSIFNNRCIVCDLDPLP